jgi:hypothetical protein
VYSDTSPALPCSSSSSPSHYKWFEGLPNRFNLWRRYFGSSYPDRDPEKHTDIMDLREGPEQNSEPGDPIATTTSKVGVPANNGLTTTTTTVTTETAAVKAKAQPATTATANAQSPSFLRPFPNLASFELGEWYIQGGAQFSVDGLKRLVDLAQRPGFAKDILEADWSKIFQQLRGPGERVELVSSSPGKDEEKETGQKEEESMTEGEGYDDGDGDDDEGDKEDKGSVNQIGVSEWVDDDGWMTSPVTLPIPLLGKTRKRVVGTLYHRSIVSIVREKIADEAEAPYFHYEPFELYWRPNSKAPAQRVHSELYNSDAFMKAHQELQNSPPEPGCTRPRVVIGLMFWSDETHVSSFSAEKLWPCYMAFANESKYRRCRPTLNLYHHIAYFDKVCHWAGISQNTTHYCF